MDDSTIVGVVKQIILLNKVGETYSKWTFQSLMDVYLLEWHTY